MDTALFDYELPETFIAQQPAEPRDSSRLLVLDRATGRIEHRGFRDIGHYLRAGDLLVANNSRVIPARLHGHKATGGKVEILLLRRLDAVGQRWECLVRGRNIVAGVTIIIENLAAAPTPPAPNAAMAPATDRPSQTGFTATVVAVEASGARIVDLSASLAAHLSEMGEVPLPPYITQYAGDRERYQTVYSQPEGSVAAPTAGLHFTPELLLDLRRNGIRFEPVTLHVGLDTFRPVSVERVEKHPIHSEWAELTPDAAKHINQVSLAGGRIIAVGTTTVRTLEWAATCAQGIAPYDPSACPWQRTAAFSGDVDLFIRPGYRFRAVDMLITNFHLPKSSLLLLVSAFVGQAHGDDVDAGRRVLLQAYEVAKQTGYRFFSFGDAMLIL